MTFSPADFTGIGLALALGLLVGVERGWALREQAAGKRFAGIRTYGLLGLLGGLAGIYHNRAENLTTILLGTAALLVVLGYWRGTQRDTSVSGTASIVGLLTMGCGFLAGTGNHALASVASGTMVILLALRRQLHAWISVISEGEMLAIARFALIALVVLPLLPDKPFGPYLAWQPRQLWMVVVLVCGFSFLGYIAARRLGASRAVLATATAGALVSSTAVTAALGGKLRDGDGDPAVLNAGIALASAVMFIRVMALTGALAPYVLPLLAIWAVPGMVASLAGAAWLMRHRGADVDAEGQLALRNPFAIGPALVLMALVMVLTVLARWVQTQWGDAGLATVLALSGLLDVDSAIITMGTLPHGTLPAATAALILAPPVLLNTLVKAGMAASLAGPKATMPALVTLGASILLASAALPLLI